MSNGERIRWAFGVLNTHDPTPLRDFWTDSTVLRVPTGTHRGVGEIVAYFESVFAALPDFQVEVVALVEQGDDVFVQWHVTGHHTGAPFEGIEPTGRRLELDGFDHFTFSGGEPVSNFVVYDQMQFARAIGMMPPDGSAADRAMKAAFNAKTRVAAKLRRG
jgi:predicted ester cyclase